MTMHKRKNKRLISQTLTALLVGSLCAMFMCGCTRVKKEELADVSRFVCVEDKYEWKVVYDRYTRVMYAVSQGSYNRGTFTLLVDADGKPLLWNGKGDDF